MEFAPGNAGSPNPASDEARKQVARQHHRARLYVADLVHAAEMRVPPGERNSGVEENLTYLVAPTS